MLWIDRTANRDGNMKRLIAILGPPTVLSILLLCHAVAAETRLDCLTPDTTTRASQGYDVRFASDSRALLASDKESIRIWDVDTLRECPPIVGHKYDVSALDVAPDGRFVASGDTAGTVYVWRLPEDRDGHAPPELLHKLSRPDRTDGDKHPLNTDDRVLKVAFSAKSSMLAAAYFEDENIVVVLWDWARHEQIKKLQPKVRGQVWQLRYSSDGKCLLLSVWRTGPHRAKRPPWHLTEIYRWDTVKYELVRKPETLDNAWWCAFSPDGRQVATLSQPAAPAPAPSALHVWDLSTGKSMPLGNLPYSASGRIAFSPDGRALATASNDRPWSVKLWNLADGRTIAEQEVPREGVEIRDTRIGSVDAFSPDGRFVAVSLLCDVNLRRRHFLWKLPSDEAKESSRMTRE
jgi:WD40 repeat protein